MAERQDNLDQGTGLLDTTEARIPDIAGMSSEELHREIERLDVVLAHDYLTQKGGAERVVVEFARMFNPRALVVALFNADTTFEPFADYDVRPSALNRIPVFRRDPRPALPFLARAWSGRKPVAGDVAFCSTSGWAHGLKVAPGVPKVIYCHNPARWLYQPEDYLKEQPGLVRKALQWLRPSLLRWDRKAAASASVYIANSSSVAARIRAAYGIEAEVIFPPVAIDVDGQQEPVPGVEAPFFITVARGRGYKGGQQLIDAFRELPEHRLVVVGKAAFKDLPPNVHATGFVSDAQLRWLYSNATGLISTSREDFGLTPIEANAFGTPSLLLRAGGFLDSTVEGVNGCFIDDDALDTIREGVRRFPREWDRDAVREHARRFSPEAFRDAIYRVVLKAVYAKV